jgi:hypothetical protein
MRVTGKESVVTFADKKIYFGTGMCGCQFLDNRRRKYRIPGKGSLDDEETAR